LGASVGLAGAVVGATVGAAVGVAAGAQAANTIDSTSTAIRILNNLELMLLSPYKNIEWFYNIRRCAGLHAIQTGKGKITSLKIGRI
jgi:hypothetical protein